MTPDSFPTVTDIETYVSRGFVTSPKIIPQELLEEALFGVERYYAGERDWPLPISGGYLDWRPSDGDCVRISDYVSLQCREFRELVCGSDLGRVFSALSTSDTIRLFHDQLISKPPGQGTKSTVGWHVDAAYWKTCKSPNMLTAWIPLLPYDEEMGPITMLEGSHTWPGYDWMTTFNNRDHASLEDRIRASGHPITPTPVLIEPGQVSFHHGRMIHGSKPNRGTRNRVALTVHVQCGDNRYQRHIGPDGEVAAHVNDALCRSNSDGDPDYRDPDICPVIWPRD
jgi:hypothetical protein